MKSRKLYSALLALLLSVVMIFSLAACQGGETTKAPDESKTPEATTLAPSSDEPTKPSETEPPVPGKEYPSVGEPDPAESDDTLTNNTRTLLIQEGTFDGKFNPFFYTSAYDGDVCGMVNVGLLTVDATGAVVAGYEHDTVAQGYEIYYTNDLTNYTRKDTYEEGDYVVYDITLKHGMKFSDGTDITAEDVLFNYYVLLDPAYVGSSTLYTLPILGLSAYRTQIADDATRAALYDKADKIFEAGRGEYAANDDFTEEDYNLYWESLDKAGVAFAQDIVDYVNSKYPSYNEGGTKYAGETPLDLSVEGNRVAFGMTMWGFGAFDSETEYVANEFGAKGFDPETEKYKTLYTKSEEATNFFDANGQYYAQVKEAMEATEVFTLAGYEQTDAGYKCEFEAFSGERFQQNTLYKDTFTAGNGEQFDMVNNFPTTETYWAALQDGYTDEEGVIDYANLEATEAANVELISVAAEAFVMANAEVGSVKSIAGLVAGKATVDELEYDNVKIILTEQNPKAILSLGVTVTPKAYYCAGYDYKADAIVNAGVPLGLTDPSFMEHLNTLNSAPMGGGCYKFVEFKDGNVTFVRNDYHYTMGDETVTNAKIKNLSFIAVESGKEYDTLKAGDVHYANPSATADVVAEIATIDNLTSILVDNLGYGYININPAASQVEEFKFNNVHARIALNAALDISKCLDYYPNGLADVICRSQSQVSWAYPEGATPIYPFDESMKTSIEELKLAGYTFDEASGKFTDVPEIDFYIPGATEDHPAGGIYLRTQELLATIGVTINIKNDSSLLSNVKDGKHPVYTMAWQSSQDPDMYQVYHYKSAAESVVSNGIAWLYQNGGDDALGTLEITKLDGSKETMNQKQVLEYLGELIEMGTKYMSVEERKPIYEKALEVLAQLAIEIPTYQRKNMFAYDNTILDATTMSDVVTPYWGPIAQIWKLSFAD